MSLRIVASRIWSGIIRSGIGLAAVALMLAADPASAQGPDRAPPRPFDKGADTLPAPPAKLPHVHADRTRGLDFLFGALKAAPDEASARHVEARIWALWMATPSDTAALLMARAKVALEARQLDVALKLLDAVVALRPDYIEGWNRRATIYYLRDDYGHALQDIRQVLAREPRHFGALSGLGLIYQARGEDAEALAWYRRALEQNPHMPGIAQRVEDLALKVEGEAI